MISLINYLRQYQRNDGSKGFVYAYEAAGAERLFAALVKERDKLLQRLWPNREFGPQSFDEVATFIEQERQTDKEYADALAEEVGRLKVELHKAHRNFIDAWEALPGGQDHSVKRIERWLIEDMKPAVDRARLSYIWTKETSK